MSQEKEGSIDSVRDTVVTGGSEDQSTVDQKKVLTNKKRWDLDMDSLLARIKGEEAKQDIIKNVQMPSINKELKAIKAEKNATIEKRKQMVTELDKLNKDLPEKMRQLSQVESSLIYKNEDKINTAIQKLDWTLQHQQFKLTEERKIVTEIDRLRRSKRTLAQYFTLKQEISGIRDKQRRMREERDTYFQAVSKLKHNEEALKQKYFSLRHELESLKREIDSLYEYKRHLRKMKDEQFGVRDRLKRESWKRRDEARKSFIASSQKEEEDSEVPYEKLIQLCGTLCNYLQRFSHFSTPEQSLDSLSPSSSLEVEEEIDEGHHILRKKSSDAENLEYSGSGKRIVKKNKKPRKQSSLKKMTHSSQVLEQFLALGLNAPSVLAEIPEVLEKLAQKKADLEKEVASDAGFSATESYICEMSRQASKTESHEDYADALHAEQVCAELIGEARSSEGAVGGCEGLSESSEVMSPNSDSTLEGDSGDSQTSSVVKSEDVARGFSQSLVITEADRSNNNTVTDAFRLANEHKPDLTKPGILLRKNSPPKTLCDRPKLRRANNITEEQSRPATLLVSPSFSPATVSLATPLDIKEFRSKKPVCRVASSPSSSLEPGHYRQLGSFADQLKSPSISPSSSFNAHSKIHAPLANRLSSPAPGSPTQRPARRSMTIPSQAAAAELHFDISDFPPLTPQIKSRSNSFFSKSSNEGLAAEASLQAETTGQPTAPDSSQMALLPTSATAGSPSPSALLSVSQIPAEDKSSTEKWVESSSAYFHSDTPVISLCKET